MHSTRYHYIITATTYACSTHACFAATYLQRQTTMTRF